MQHDEAIAAHCAPGVMPRAPWRVAEVNTLPDFKLRVRFMDGVTGEVDCSRLLESQEAGVFTPLRDTVLFAQAHVSCGAVTWPGGLDLAPDTMYDAIGKHGVWRP